MGDCRAWSSRISASDAGIKNMRCVTSRAGVPGEVSIRGKLVMTAPAVPLIGKVNFRQTSKEALLEFWQDATRRSDRDRHRARRTRLHRPQQPCDL